MSKNQRLNASITIGSVLEGSVKKNIGFLKSGLSSVGSAIKDVERRQKELAKQRRVLEKEGKSVEALDREYEQLDRTLAKLRRSQERWTKAAHASRRVGSTWSAMASDIGKQSRRIAIGAGLAGGAIFGLANSTASLGDGVAKTADKLGIGIEQLQEMRYAAERSGVAQSDLDKSLEKMVKNIGLALEGTGAQKDALDAMGLSADSLSKMLPNDALALIADRMQDVETNAEKAAIANDLFGRSGIGMLNMLRGGSAGLKQLAADAQKTGYVLTEEQARQAEVFQDTLLDLQLVGKGLKNTIGAELIPVVTDAMRKIANWLVGNRDKVKEFAKAFAEGAERALPKIIEVAKGVGRIGSVIAKGTTKLAEFVGGWENFGVIVGTALAAGTVAKVVAFGGAVFSLGKALFGLTGVAPLVVGGIKAIGAAMIANPIGLIVAGIAGAAYLVYKHWEPIKAFFSDLWGNVKLVSKAAWEGIKTVFLNYTPHALIYKNWEPIKAFFLDLWGSVKTSVVDGVAGIKDAWAGVKNAIGSVLDWLGEKFHWVNGIISPVIDGLRWVGETRVGKVVLDKIGWGGSDAPIQKNALGGTFRPGWHFTGEKGPELKYENRAGFVADARATRQLADYAGKVSSILHGGVNMASQAAAAAVTHVHQYSVDAQGVSAEQLIHILEQRARQAERGAMYDHVPATAWGGR